jgi:hypothetical protein
MKPPYVPQIKITRKLYFINLTINKNLYILVQAFVSKEERREIHTKLIKEN